MAPDGQERAIRRFGVFEIDLEARELRRSGVLVRLQRQPLEMLIALLEKPGEVVTREELARRLWSDGTIVDFEAGLNTAARRVRDALGDTADRPRYIQTLARRGYRFIAPVDGAPNRSGPAPRLRGTAVLTLTGAALAITTLLGWVYASGRTDRAKTIESIAVLPLRNLSGDSGQQYLADALTEELITNLARIKAWRVISRTSALSYRDTAKPLPQIASELGVQAVVEGSFQRLRDVLSITTRLVDARADRTIWAKSYQLDLKDPYALRDRLVPAMAADMRVGLPLHEQGRLSRSRQVEPAAYDAYLQGRFYEFKETEEDARTAIGWFERAIRLDPGYAPAYAALAHTYSTTGQISGNSAHVEQTRRYAQKALELDPGVAEAHVMLGGVKLFYDWDFAGAERELRTAMEINRSSADAFIYYAGLLDALGKPREAIAMARRAIQIDPRRPTLRPDLGFRYYFARMYDNAVDEFRRTLRDYPNIWVAHMGLGVTHLARGHPENAIPELKKAVEMSGGAEEARSALASAYARAGRRREALEIAGAIDPAAGSKFIGGISVADVCMSLGEKDRAFEWLAKAYEQRQYRLAFLKVDPVYDTVRSDPRFQRLLRRLGLPL